MSSLFKIGRDSEEVLLVSRSLDSLGGELVSGVMIL